MDCLQSFLDKDHLSNCYPIHALQTHGMNSERVTFWGSCKSGRLQAVAFAKKSAMTPFGCVFGYNHNFLAKLGKLLHEQGIPILLGKSDYMVPSIKYLKPWIKEIVHYDFYQVSPEDFTGCHDYPVRKAATSDIPMLVEHYQNSDWINYRGQDPAIIEREIRNTMEFESGYFFIERDGKALSVVRIVAETDRAGILDEASTLEEYKGKGMYLNVRTACCMYLFQKGKIGVGYIRDTNTSMRRVCSKTGGNFTSRWQAIHMKRKPRLRERILPFRVRHYIRTIQQRLSGKE